MQMHGLPTEKCCFLECAGDYPPSEENPKAHSLTGTGIGFGASASGLQQSLNPKPVAKAVGPGIDWKTAFAHAESMPRAGVDMQFRGDPGLLPCLIETDAVIDRGY